jgi:hypothetical protein
MHCVVQHRYNRGDDSEGLHTESMTPQDEISGADDRTGDEIYNKK